jgi:hypothetical protein
MLRAFALPLAESSSSKPAAPPMAAADIQQQLASITLNLAAVKHSVEQLHPAQLSTGASSKPVHLSPPQSLQPQQRFHEFFCELRAQLRPFPS